MYFIYIRRFIDKERIWRLFHDFLCLQTSLSLSCLTFVNKEILILYDNNLQKGSFAMMRHMYIILHNKHSQPSFHFCHNYEILLSKTSLVFDLLLTVHKYKRNNKNLEKICETYESHGLSLVAQILQGWSWSCYN